MSHKYLIGLTLLIFIAGCSSSSTKTSPEQKIKSDSTQSIQVKLPSCNPSKGLDLTNYELALQASVKAGFENIKNAEAKVSGKYSVRLLAIRSYRSLYTDYHEFFDCNIALNDDGTDLMLQAREQVTDYITNVEKILKSDNDNIALLLQEARNNARNEVDNLDFTAIDNSLANLSTSQRTSLKNNILSVDIPLEVTSTQFSAGITIPDTIDANACVSSNEKLVQPINGAGIASLEKLQKYFQQALRSPEDGTPKSYKYIVKFEIGNIHNVALDIADNITQNMDYFECEDS